MMDDRKPRAKKNPPPPSASLFPDPEPAPAKTASEAKAPPGFPPSWAAALSAEFTKPYFQTLTDFLEQEEKDYTILPPVVDRFTAFQHTALDVVRVVILGQDPYPTPGHAHGLCFSVRPGVAIPASLRNIYKELREDLGIPPAKSGSLVSWADQGILLLNAVLTVRAGSPNSHKDRGWETFTDAALKAVNDQPRPVVFLLWGSYAQKKAKLVDESRHVVLKSAHPSPLSASNGFFGSKPFSKINAALEQYGQPPIDWRLPGE